MSQENVEAVRAVYEEWAKGNFRAGTDLYDPLVLFIPIPEFPAAAHYLGREGVRDFMLHFLGAWTSLTIEAEELTNVGDSVVVTARWRGIGKGSGAHTEKRAFDVWTFRGRKAIRVEFFQSQAEALEAVGLSEQAMSQENVEIVRSLYAMWERGDFSSAEWAHPDIEFVSVDGPTPGNWTGLAGMTKGWSAWLSAWDEFRIEADEYRELGSERVLVLTRQGGRGKTSRLDLGEMRGKGAAALFHFCGGKVARLVFYWDRERALADLGLSEQDAHADS